MSRKSGRGRKASLREYGKDQGDEWRDPDPRPSKDLHEAAADLHGRAAKAHEAAGNAREARYHADKAASHLADAQGEAE